MIVVDIETSGLDTGRCGIWQIGSLEFEKPKNTFLQEGRIDNEDEITEEALELTGKTEKELRDPKKQIQKQLISNWLNWAGKCREKVLGGQNVGWDVSFIQNKCIRYDLRKKFHETTGQRSIDLHTEAQEAYRKINGIYLINETGKSVMDLAAVLKLCGISNERMIIELGKVIKKGKVHTAFEDCRLEAECFSRLLYGKNLFEEYEKFPIPKYLMLVKNNAR